MMKNREKRIVVVVVVVVVVVFFVKILDDFHDFVSECVCFPKKINHQYWGTPFFRRKVFVIGRETKTHMLPTNINEKKSLRSAPLTRILFEKKKITTTTPWLTLLTWEPGAQ